MSSETHNALIFSSQALQKCLFLHALLVGKGAEALTGALTDAAATLRSVGGLGPGTQAGEAPLGGGIGLPDAVMQVCVCV